MCVRDKEIKGIRDKNKKTVGLFRKKKIRTCSRARSIWITLCTTCTIYRLYTLTSDHSTIPGNPMIGPRSRVT